MNRHVSTLEGHPKVPMKKPEHEKKYYVTIGTVSEKLVKNLIEAQCGKTKRELSNLQLQLRKKLFRIPADPEDDSWNKQTLPRSVIRAMGN